MRRTLTFRNAINEALDQEMARDSSVLLLGEDIAGGEGAATSDAWGGIFGVTKGLRAKYPKRVIDTPISESAFLGAGVGAAMSGLRPVVELMFNDFIGVCFDQILNQAAKMRYMLGGKAHVPIVIRTAFGCGFRSAAQHSQSLYALFTHIPGLKCVVPSTPGDAKGLLISAIRDDDPVIFFEHRKLYDLEGEVPPESYCTPLGKAHAVRTGKDVTVVSLGEMVHLCREAAQGLSEAGVDCEIIDLRCTSPLDEDLVLASIRKTGRVVIVDEAAPRCSVATDIAALAVGHAFYELKAPVRLVTAPHTPVPFAEVLEDLYKPCAEGIREAVLSVVRSHRRECVTGRTNPAPVG